eukprot:SM000126S26319  [mRNA]  locus=s126:155769:157810:- [translate_table: standard]
MEDELKDARNFFDYLAPRPLRRLYFGFGAVSCTVGFVISLSKLLADPGLEVAAGDSNNVGINLLGIILFISLFAEKRVEQRQQIRESQIKKGDREVFVNARGEKMSKLKPVDDEWIIRRLDRWGQQEFLPQIGPKVGSFTGYSAIKMAQAMPAGCSIISFEKDFSWHLVAKRFVWQAKFSSKIDVRWGDAIQKVPRLQRKIDFLFLDGKPSEYLDYLRAAEPLLSDGATVVADNAGVLTQLSSIAE